MTESQKRNRAKWVAALTFSEIADRIERGEV